MLHSVRKLDRDHQSLNKKRNWYWAKTSSEVLEIEGLFLKGKIKGEIEAIIDKAVNRYRTVKKMITG
ncbi:hypothetical protein E3N88_27689 [Mikania micrantha]|uniref:Uncharacterized protein n=1 Tax=Mikania micrantha TaxID=192012 RepID=A0A5N6MXG7_9ASTR|nr:hypothetical protein E3N88_27689 [Mikania micrantha]